MELCDANNSLLENAALKQDCIFNQDGIWYDATDDRDAACLVFETDVSEIDAELYGEDLMWDEIYGPDTPSELSDDHQSSAGLVVAIVVSLLAAVAIGIIVYCLCCKGDGDADEDFKQMK